MMDKKDMGEFGHKLFVKILEFTSNEGDWECLYKRCKKLDCIYTDENFPACANSLIKDWDEEEVEDKIEKWARFVWKRPQQFLQPDDIALFHTKIEPSDIKQGCLGDCYFLSVLSVLAEKPHLIEKLFLTKEVNKYGIYGVEFWKQGQPCSFIIDDLIPCSGRTKGPCFSSANGNELWVLLMEKAWAKAYGSYERIEAGFADQVMHDLTGAPCQLLSHDDEELWTQLLDAAAKSYVIAGSAGTTDASKELLEEMGLIGNHSYGILDVRDVDTKDGPEQLIKLRNPWGDYEWTGDWSDSSTNWTMNPELKEELEYSDANDGSFWMSFSDFCHYFSRVQICRVNDNYMYSHYKTEHSKGSFSCIRMIITERSLQYLTLSQVDKRMFPRGHSYEYSTARMILAKVNNNGELEYLIGKMKSDRDMWEEIVLESGDYFVYIEVDWSGESYPIVINAYGESKAMFVREEKETYPKFKFLEEVYMSCAKKVGKKNDYSTEGAPLCYKYSDMCPEGYGYNYFENFSDDATIKEVVTYTRFDGLQLVKPFSGTSYEVKVPPGDKLIVLLRQIGTYGYNLSFSYSSNILFTSAALRKKVKERGSRMARKDPRLNVELNIYVYSLKHGAGICYLYENCTDNPNLEESVRFLTLEESVKFTTNGLIIAGYESNEVKVKIGPGESEFIELKATTSNWSIQTAIRDNMVTKVGYIFMSELGHGSFGKVYLGQKSSDPPGPMVAIKEMQISRFDMYGEGYLDREISLIQKVNSLHVVQLLEVIRRKKEIYLIYEYCNGGDLNSYLREQGGRLGEPIVKDICTQLFLGLRTLWQKKIMHRDLKLGNVLLHYVDKHSRTFDLPVFKLCDFGFAREISPVTPEEKKIDKNTDTVLFTRNMTILGTPQYMAPELLARMPYSLQADIWSLGVLLYRLIAGYVPFQGYGHELVKNVAGYNIRSLPKEVHSSNELKDFLTRALQRNPHNRLTWKEIPLHPFMNGGTLKKGKEKEGLKLKTSLSGNNIHIKETGLQHMEKGEETKEIESKKGNKETILESVEGDDHMFGEFVLLNIPKISNIPPGKSKYSGTRKGGGKTKKKNKFLDVNITK